MIEREYEYRLRAGRVQARAALWTAGAIFMTYLAVTNDRGLELFIFPLKKDSATIAYWVFAGLSALFAVIDCVNVVRRGELRQRIAFTEEGLLVPKSNWTAEEMLIPYAGVQKVTTIDDVTVIRHPGGEYTLRLDQLPSERDYAEILRHLAARVQAAKAGVVLPPPAAGPPPPHA